MVAPVDVRTLPVGARVGAHRWPMEHAHPDGWERPHVGTLLALDDPDAWAMAHHPQASPAQIAALVRARRAEGLLDMNVPVRWDFGTVLWERWDQLVTPERDLHNWEVARDLRYQDIANPYQGRARG